MIMPYFHVFKLKISQKERNTFEYATQVEKQVRKYLLLT